MEHIRFKDFIYNCNLLYRRYKDPVKINLVCFYVYCCIMFSRLMIFTTQCVFLLPDRYLAPFTCCRRNIPYKSELNNKLDAVGSDLNKVDNLNKVDRLNKAEQADGYIQILHAQTDIAVCSNKLRILLATNWETGGEDYPHSKSGFDINIIRKFIACQTLQITYIISEDIDGFLIPNEFEQDVKKITISRTDNGKFCRTFMKDDGDSEESKELIMGHIEL